MHALIPSACLKPFHPEGRKSISPYCPLFSSENLVSNQLATLDVFFPYSHYMSAEQSID